MLLREDVPGLREKIAALRADVDDVVRQPSDGSPLAELPPAERATYERMFELIYERSVNRIAARKLILTLFGRRSERNIGAARG